MKKLIRSNIVGSSEGDEVSVIFLFDTFSTWIGLECMLYQTNFRSDKTQHLNDI